MKRILFLIVPVVIVFGAALTFPRMNFYFIRGAGGGGDLLWSNNEAYLFMSEQPVGYHLSGAEWLAEPIREYFRAPAIPEVEDYSIIILHVTPSGVERYIQKPKASIDSLTPLRGAIYANCAGGICKWTGTQFDLITSEEEQRMGGRNRLSNDWNEFTNANGWSKRLIRVTGSGGTPIHGQFSIEVSKQLRLVVTEGNPTSVDLLRANEPSERIWYHKRDTSMVSKAKYERVFATGAWDSGAQR